jgi:hypothetical protein
VWGAGLGAIVVVFVGGFFLFSSLTGGGGDSVCDNPLEPLPGAEAPPNTAAGFQEADTNLGRLITFFQQGDLNAANSFFYGATHNFMHTAEPAIRDGDEELGKELCEAVIQFENDFDTAGRTDPQVLAEEVIAIREYLRRGAEVLGFPRPNG